MKPKPKEHTQRAAHEVSGGKRRPIDRRLLRARLFGSALVALLTSCLFLLIGCQPAKRFPNITVAPSKKNSPPAKDRSLPSHYGWMSGEEKKRDIPIEFVHPTSRPKEWQELPTLWNHYPPPYGSLFSIHLGQSPFGAAASIAAAAELQTIKIKVPLGLPDPTSYIPESNPPTYGKWRLGQLLFFDTQWLTKEGGKSCASCHDPKTGFAEFQPPGPKPRMNAPSLINCVYSKHQFWDGRVTELELVLQRSLADEQPTANSSNLLELRPSVRHAWSGIVPRLNRRVEYRLAFREIFGIRQPTTDAVAKSLATYMRTILSGNSLYDRANAIKGSKRITAAIFESLLTDDTLKKLGRFGIKKSDVAYELARGHSLVRSSAVCGKCHTGWNFTDDDFHNISIRESDHIQIAGKENGRFRRLPPGLKQARMIGAFRTPSLRNLPRTGPYFHDGSAATLEQAVQWYNRGIHDQVNQHLDPVLSAGPKKAIRLELPLEQVEAIALFLRALDGEPIPAIIKSPPQ